MSEHMFNPYANHDPLSVHPVTGNEVPDLETATDDYLRVHGEMLDMMDTATIHDKDFQAKIKENVNAQRAADAAARREALVAFMASEEDDPESFGLPPAVDFSEYDDFEDVVVDLDKIEKL